MELQVGVTFNRLTAYDMRMVEEPYAPGGPLFLSLPQVSSFLARARGAGAVLLFDNLQEGR